MEILYHFISLVFMHMQVSRDYEIDLGVHVHIILEKWFPLQGELAHSLNYLLLKTPIPIQVKSKSNPFLFLLLFLPLSPGPT